MKENVSRIITLVSVVGSIVCLNILAVQHFVRVDLTKGKTFTLSEASVNTMSALEDPVKVTAYFTKDLPAPYSGNAQFVRDLLEEYRAHAKGMLSYEYVDPQDSESEEDKAIKKDVKQDIFGRRLREPTSVEKELQEKGVQPVEIVVIEEDQEQKKRGYMGLVIQYQDKSEVIPVVREAEHLEYNLTALIQNLTRSRLPVLGITQGHGEPSLDAVQGQQPGPMVRIKEALSRLYEVKAVNLKVDTSVDESIDALWVMGATQPFSEDALKAIDIFMMRGKSATFMVDNVTVDLRTFQASPVDVGLKSLLSPYGIDIGPTLIADAECFKLGLTRNEQGRRVPMTVPYPFVPEVKTLSAEHLVTRQVSNVTMPFVAPLYLAENLGTRKGTILVESSERSWIEAPTPENMTPNRFTERLEVELTGPYAMVASVEGALPSAYIDGKSSDAASRVMVTGSSYLLDEQFLSQSNAALAMNMIDWMLLDPALLNMRTRAMLTAPIDPKLSDQKRYLVKWGNVVVVPLLLALFGVVRWRLRVSRQKSLAV